MRNLRILIAMMLAAACGPKPVGSTLQTPPPPPDDQNNGLAPMDETPPPPPGNDEAPPELAFPQNEDFRKAQPEPGPIKPFEQPKLTKFKLKNGIDVYLVEKHELPTISAELVFEGGSVNDPAGLEGQASLCMGLMSEGTEKLDKIAFDEALADIASSVGSYAGTDQQGVTLATLTKNLDATLDLWTDTLLHPGLRPDEFDRMVKRRIEGLKQVKGSPAPLAGRLVDSIAWGEKHPFGHVLTEASTNALKVEQCKPYIATWIKPQGARMYVVGDITQAQIEEKMGARLADWKGAPKKGVKPGKGTPRKGKIFFVDVPGASQSVIALVGMGPARTAKDYFSTMMMSTILGGGFASRINMNIREKKGFAYGARGGFSYTRAGSEFNAGGSVRGDATIPSIIEVYKEVKGLQESKAADADGNFGPATDEEMAREKQGFILALPSRFSTGGSILGTYRDLLYYGLPLDYYEKYVQNVQAVDAAAVKKAGKAYLHADDLKIFVVGDGATVLPGLKKLLEDKAVGAGELVVLDADGKVIPQ